MIVEEVLVCFVYTVMLLLCLGAYAQARYTVVCVCVFVCVCACRLLLKDQWSASKSFYRLLVTFSWILIRGFGNASFSSYAWFCFTGNAIAAFSEECVAKLIHEVLLLYLI